MTVKKSIHERQQAKLPQGNHVDDLKDGAIVVGGSKTNVLLEPSRGRSDGLHRFSDLEPQFPCHGPGAQHFFTVKSRRQKGVEEEEPVASDIGLFR